MATEPWALAAALVGVGDAQQFGREGLFQARFRFFVGPAGDAHRTRHDFDVEQQAVAVDVEAEGEGGGDIGQAKAELGGGFRREHGHGAFGQVEVGATRPRFEVGRAVWGDEGGGVGDVDPQTAVFPAQGVVGVGVAGVVDRQGGEVGQIAARFVGQGGQDGR